MATNLIEVVNTDYYGDVEVIFDYEEGNYYISEVSCWFGGKRVNIAGRQLDWKVKCEIVEALEAVRQFRNAECQNGQYPYEEE